MLNSHNMELWGPRNLDSEYPHLIPTPPLPLPQGQKTCQPTINPKSWNSMTTSKKGLSQAEDDTHQVAKFSIVLL